MPAVNISEELKRELEKRKNYPEESLEDVIWDLIEDCEELSEETKREIEEAEREIKEGKYYTLDEIKEELGIEKKQENE